MQCVREWRALSVCVLWCMQSLFTAREDGVRRSPSAEVGRCRTPNPESRYAPTARELQTPHTLASLSPSFRGGRSTEHPGAPVLSAVCVSPSFQQPPGSGAATSNKNSGDARQVENYWRQLPKLHAANLSTWRTLHNFENAAKNSQHTKRQRHRRNRHRRASRRQPPKRRTHKGPTPHREPAREPGNKDENKQQTHDTANTTRPAEDEPAVEKRNNKQEPREQEEDEGEQRTTTASTSRKITLTYPS